MSSSNDTDDVLFIGSDIVTIKRKYITSTIFLKIFKVILNLR